MAVFQNKDNGNRTRQAIQSFDEDFEMYRTFSKKNKKDPTDFENNEEGDPENEGNGNGASQDFGPDEATFKENIYNPPPQYTGVDPNLNNTDPNTTEDVLDTEEDLDEQEISNDPMTVDGGDDIPNNDPPYGSDIDPLEELTPEQQKRYNWNEAYARFKKAHPGIPEEDVAIWTRKSIKEGWRIENLEIPDLNEPRIVAETGHWGPVEFDVLHVYTRTYDEAYILTKYWSGQWFWHQKHTGKVSVRQLHGSVSKFNNKHHTYSKQMVDDLAKVCHGDQKAQEYATIVHQTKLLDDNFSYLVKRAQKRLFPRNPDIHHGMYNETTEKAVKSEASCMREQEQAVIDAKIIKESVAGQDSTAILLAKLYYITGNQQLYEAAKEELGAGEEISQSYNPPFNPTQVTGVARLALIKEAQKVLYYPQLNKINGKKDAQFYAAIDQWDQEYGTDPESMDAYRRSISYQMALKEYRSLDDKRAVIQRQLQELQNRVAYNRNMHAKTGNKNYYYTANSISWEAYFLQYNELRPLQWPSIQAKYFFGSVVSNRNYGGFELENPFIGTGEYEVSGNYYTTRPASLDHLLYPHPDGYQPSGVSKFYSDLGNASMDYIDDQIEDMQDPLLMLRGQALQHEAFDKDQAVQDYKEAVMLFETEKYDQQSSQGTSSAPADGSISSIKILPLPTPQDVQLQQQLEEEKEIEKMLNQYNNFPEPDYKSLPVQHINEQYKTGTTQVDNLYTIQEGQNDFERVRLGIDAQLEVTDQESPAYKFLLQMKKVFSQVIVTEKFMEYKPQMTGVLDAEGLMELAGMFMDEKIEKQLISTGHVEATELTRLRDRETYLKEQGIGAGWRTVPAYFLMDSTASANTPTVIKSPDSKYQGPSIDELMAGHGVPLNIFVRYDSYDDEWVMKAALGEDQTQTREVSASSRSEAIVELFEELEGSNVFPKGTLVFNKAPNDIVKMRTRDNHWTWSEVLAWVAVVLAVAAAPFTGGGSLSIAGTVLTLGSIAAAIGSEIASMHEKSVMGDLSGGDYAQHGLGILASLLPGLGALSKVAKTGSAFAKAFGAGNRFFVVTKYTAGITDALVQGWLLADGIYEAYLDIEEQGLEGTEKNNALARLFFIGLLYGGITYKSLRSDAGGLQKQFPGSVHFDKKHAQLINPGEVEQSHDLGKQVVAKQNVSGSTLGSNTAHTSPKVVGGVEVERYSIDGKSYTKEEFIEKLNSGEFDGKNVEVNAPHTDKDAVSTIDAYNGRRSEIINSQKINTTNAGSKTPEEKPGGFPGLAPYKNIRSNLGNARTKQYLNNDELWEFEKTIKDANPDVLKTIDQMDEMDFAEMVRGYKDLKTNGKITTFIDAIKDLESFSGKYGWLTYWKVTPEMKFSLNTIKDLKEGDKLLNTGEATDIQLGSLHAFTASGDFINVPMRYNPSFMGSYAEKGLQHIKDCLEELRKVPERLMVNQRVYSGKAFSKADFESKFMGGTGSTHDYPGFISTSMAEPVAEAFAKITKKWAGDGEKVAVIQRIISKDGVYIDDLSDWGEHLGAIRHSDEPEAVQRQFEVLLNPGQLKQVGEPIPIMNGDKHVTIDGMKAYYVDLTQ